ncbi:tRNA (adenosine(37)-N6)-threonylcarbamoyltransferase complex dimerization subunit type 1 TsaB [Pararhodobacter sp. CCB-MM2]|uniref:tRNA (adenosine(37)-N6)-threonylcarbamoyltransferase complex dimerization subunit type 1 TsaB n=1 Tax=Pararhodobacter sp. CCB-MM2 TaxID=1786003 RepID=UPI0009F60F18|nr:tRNA (adenosine(37)-N6)-threonylcarbamoyltransferase complex dimerization subunit type 1 TsaB [Pararhodobacter sp. CCB-MM2]
MPSDATVLGFDTSGPWIACAVIRGDSVLAHHHQDLPKGQGEALMPALQAVLDAAGITWDQLDALGAGIGPGNFTGIRITCAAARGLALGLGIPAIGVDRFDAVALDAPERPVAVAALRGQAWVRAPGAAPTLPARPPDPSSSTPPGFRPRAPPQHRHRADLGRRRGYPSPRLGTDGAAVGTACFAAEDGLCH